MTLSLLKRSSKSTSITLVSLGPCISPIKGIRLTLTLELERYPKTLCNCSLFIRDIAMITSSALV